MDAWSKQEVDLLVTDYMNMLAAELRGLPINKTIHRKALQQMLSNRSDGSIEFKHQNLSAVLIKHGLPYIIGYKPRWNYQFLLEETLLSYLNTHQSTEVLFSDFATQPLLLSESKVDFQNWKEIPPPQRPYSFSEEPQIEYLPIKRNYLEQEQKNTAIGQSGELLVLNYEKWRLYNAGLPELADQIRWISKEEGDGAGFDILSKTLKGQDIYIEVKTTTLGKETPIFFSKRENDFSDRKREAYHLYRVFNLKQNPKMFSKSGRFQDFCKMEATGFKGYF